MAISGSRERGIPANSGVVGVSDDMEDAHRVFKQVKAGMYESVSDLDHRELGLLYRYYPEVLPDVQVQEDRAK